MDITSKKAKWKRLTEIIGFTAPLDGIISVASNNICIDVVKLDKQIPNYNGDTCVYKGKPNYSMSEAVKEEWGEEAVKLIEDLL